MTTSFPSRRWALSLGPDLEASGSVFSLEDVMAWLERLHLFSVAQQLSADRRPGGEDVPRLQLQQGEVALLVLSLPSLVFVVASSQVGGRARVLDDPLSASEVLWLVSQWRRDPGTLDSLTWRGVSRLVHEVTAADWLLGGAGLRPDLDPLGHSRAPVATGVFRAHHQGWPYEPQKLTILTRLSWQEWLKRGLLAWQRQVEEERGE